MSGGAKVLLVDENDDFVDALGAWLESEIADLKVVARAHSLAEAIDRATLHRPDLVISDASLPDGNGFEIVRRILAVAPDAAFWVLTLHEREEFADAARAAGAEGCIEKTAVTKKLLPAVRALMAIRTKEVNRTKGKRK